MYYTGKLTAAELYDRSTAPYTTCTTSTPGAASS